MQTDETAYTFSVGFIHDLWIIIHLLYIGARRKRKDTPSKRQRMAQPCALSVSLNLLLLITSFIGSNKSIINDVLSSIKDSPQNDSYMSPWLLHQHKQTDNQSMVSVTKDSTVRFTALRGIAARKLRHIRPHGNFMLSGVLWCLSSIIINHESMMCVCPLTPHIFPYEHL